MPEGERERLERYPEFAPVGVPGRPHAPEHLVSGGETIEVAGISFECLAVPGPLARARRVLRRRRALQRRPALRRLGRPRRPARRRLGHAARLGPDARRAAPARDGRPPGPRPRDDARRRARAQPVPRRAPRRGGMSEKFQAPRGTHDVLPRDHLWWRVIRTIEEQCAQYGWSRVSTPGFEETALFERTSGAGVRRRAQGDVHVRGPRRPLAHAAAGGHRADRARLRRARPRPGAAAGQGVHDRADVPLRPARPRPLPRALAAVARGDRLGRSRRRRRGDPVLRGAPAAARRDRVGAPAQLDRRRELPSAVRRAARRVARRASRARSRRGGRAQARDERPPGLRRQERAACARRSTVAPKIGDSLCDDCREHFDAVKAHLDAYGIPYMLDPALVRGLDYYTRTTFEFVGPEENVNSTICGGGRYDGLVEAVGGPATPGIGFGAGLERLLLAMEREGATADAPRLDLFVAVRGARAARTAPPADRGVAGGGPLGRHRLRWPLDEGTAHAGAAARRGDRRRRAQRRDVRGAAARGGGPRRERASRRSRWPGATSCAASCARTTPAAASRSPAGSTRAATTAASSSSTSATTRGRSSSSSTRSTRRRAETAHEIRNEFVAPGEGEVVARAAGAVNPNLADRRDRDPGRRAARSSRARRRSRSSSTRRTSTRRSASATAGSTCATERMQRNLRLNHTAIAGIRRAMDERGFVDVWTPSMTRGTPEGARDFLVPVRLQPGQVLRARAVAAALQAALHGRRDRPLLPDRDVLARRGSPRRPAVRVPPARPRDGVRRAARRCST